MEVDGLSATLKQKFKIAFQGKGDANAVTIVFADSAYSLVLGNWLRHALPFVGNNLVIFSLDEKLDAALREQGLTSILLPYCGRLDELWLLRLRVFEALVELGVSFIHSDADAVWLADPRKYCLDLNVDLAISPGTIWPPEAVEQWGFVLCCGFFVARAVPAMAKMLPAVRRASARDRDDQAALNRVLVSANVNWRTEGLSYDVQEVMNRSFRNYHDIVLGRTTSEFDLTLALLPQDLFQRIPRSGHTAMVMHPLTPKVSAEKIEVMRSMGCWRD